MIERTTDLNVINSVFKHEAIKRFVCDDYSEDVEYIIHDSLYYLAAYDGPDLMGMFLSHPISSTIVMAHLAMLPCGRGEKSRELGIEAINWVFNNTAYSKINGMTPIYNKIAIKYNLDVGMKKEGVNKKSFMRNGKLHDQIYFGITKSDWAT